MNGDHSLTGVIELLGWITLLPLLIVWFGRSRRRPPASPPPAALPPDSPPPAGDQTPADGPPDRP